VEQSDWKNYQPVCRLAHDMLNKLSVIVGLCDLVSAEAEPGTECAARLAAIHDTAKSLAQEVVKRECQLSTLIRSSDANKSEDIFA
jgi:hypothetical protein